jgi:glycosidase
MTSCFSWLSGQIVYEIFPERFEVGHKYTKAEKLALSCYQRANDYVKLDWNEAPAGAPGSRPGSKAEGKDFFGGDLDGIVDRLDYLQDLGVTTLFLTPIFTAPSNHKYDTSNFLEVDEQFGGDGALVSLIGELHRRGMHLFMDIAFNHISDIHPWFVSMIRDEAPYNVFFLPGADFSAAEFGDPESPEFIRLDFKIGSSVEDVCAQIESDWSTVELKAAPRTVDWLNELLGKAEIRQHLGASEQVPSFDEKADDSSAHAAKVLNRRLLEAKYPAVPRLRNRVSVETLCRQLRARATEVGLVTTSNTIGWLNELLARVGLYDVMVRAHGADFGNAARGKRIRSLKERYERSREEYDLKRLNRCIIEAAYWQYAPPGYQCWQGHRELPELDLTDKTLQGKLYRDPDSVLQRYLAMGVDGFRFDAANDVGLGVIRDIRETLATKFPNAAFVGEVTNYAGDWIQPEVGYHGVMNYYFHSAVHAWLIGRISSRQMNYVAQEYYEGYGHDGAVRSWNILSSHDTPRLASLLETDDAARKLAVIAQFTLPGAPFIYYGEEIGMVGAGDPACRGPMVWQEDRWDKATFELYKRLIRLRKSRRELREGRFLMLGHKMDSDVLAFLRYTESLDQVAIVVLNRSSEDLRRSDPRVESLFIPHSHLYDGLWLKDELTGARKVKMDKGCIRLDMPKRSAVILTPDDTESPSYRFYKPRNRPDW